MSSDNSLRKLVDALVAGDEAAVKKMLAASPELATARFEGGATRQSPKQHFVETIERYIYAGDTALHLAAAAYRTGTIRMLLGAGAEVHATNRRGQEALHSAAVGGPGARGWNPEAQAATVALLLQAGADPDVLDKDGVAPLHKAVRTRCAAAVRALLAGGADPARTNKNGSTPMLLAMQNTGRSGSGSAEAKAQQREIVLLLEQALRQVPAKP